MDSRKRPYSDDEDSVTAKKRVLTGPNGTPHVNGNNEQEEPTENDNIEVRRVGSPFEWYVTSKPFSFSAKKQSLEE